MGGHINNGLLQSVCMSDGDMHGVYRADLHHHTGVCDEQCGAQIGVATGDVNLVGSGKVVQHVRRISTSIFICSAPHCG